jgi:hypothetical protein
MAKQDLTPPNQARWDSGATTDRPRSVNRTSASTKYAGVIMML